MLFSLYPYQNFSDYNLDWIINTVKELTPRISELETWRSAHEEEYAELLEMYNNIMSGNFPNSMINALKEWINRNAIDLIGELVKTVFFGLTDSGYFVAYIPESWSDITFNTSDYDITLECMTEFGHLILSY